MSQHDAFLWDVDARLADKRFLQALKGRKQKVFETDGTSCWQIRRCRSRSAQVWFCCLTRASHRDDVCLFVWLKVSGLRNKFWPVINEVTQTPWPRSLYYCMSALVAGLGHLNCLALWLLRQLEPWNTAQVQFKHLCTSHKCFNFLALFCGD